MAKMQIEKVETPEDFSNAKFIRLYPSGFVAVDAEDYDILVQHHWKNVKSKHNSYAARKFKVDGVTHYIRMHREIMQTPVGMIVHHKNSNTFDNRKSNLVNLAGHDHHALHKNLF